MKPIDPDISIEDLKAIFDYDPETGKIIRKKCHDPRLAGCEAGFIHHTGYRQIKIKSRGILAQRIAWAIHYGEWPGEFLIDHKNHDRTDNRIENLRKATFAQNFINSSVTCNETGFRGVHLDKRIKRPRYFSVVLIGGKPKYLGYHDTAEAAAKERDEYVRSLHGDFVPSLEVVKATKGDRV